jgi:hypothetical protein
MTMSILLLSVCPVVLVVCLLIMATDVANNKTCRFCQSRINSQASVCPRCQSQQATVSK